MEINIELGLTKEEYIKRLETIVLTQRSLIKRQETIIESQNKLIKEIKETIKLL